MESRLQQREPQKAEIDRPNLTGIPTQMKLNFEQRSGMSFDDVRVHYNSDKPAQFHALAYTQGTQIYVGPGQERSLPHELGHVIQQKAGRVRPTRWVRGQPVNDQPELEREADRAPIQCMPAPASWGVIQMLPIMPHQRGANCGYHALARAIYKFSDKPLGKPDDKNNLETQLTTLAIQMKYSVIGEAFDPYALAAVGNKFCEMQNISVHCTVVTVQDENGPERLKGFLADPNSIILVPYFPDMDSKDPKQRMRPIERGSDQENAHWGVIDPGTYLLYEGNHHGSTYDETEKENKQMDPVEVTPDQLLKSNLSINPYFNWWTFFKGNGGLKKMNNYKRVVSLVSTDTGMGKEPEPILKDFENPHHFFQQVKIVKGEIAQMSEQLRKELEDDSSKTISQSNFPVNKDPFVQNVSLAGHVVRVQKGKRK